MRAAAVRALRGPIEILDLPPPSPGPGEVGVVMECAGVNPFDWKIAQGMYEGRRPHVFPLVLGVDGCGTVDSTGPGATRFRLGDRIAGSFLHDPVGVGTYAERTMVPEANALLPVPATISSAVAAALPTAGITAVQGLDLLELGAGATLLVVGASGGVGSFAVALAKSRGIRVVAAARPSSHERLRRLGAETTIDAGAWGSDETLRLAGAGGFDGLLDLVSDGAGFARWARLLRAGARAASSVGGAHPVGEIRPFNLDMKPNVRDLETLFLAVTTGAIVRPVERTIRLEAVPAVFEEIRSGRGSGKTVVAL